MKYLAYPVYKESGIQWLGEVPEHWALKPLKGITEFINGAAFKPEEWAESGTPIIRIANLNGGEEFNYFYGEVDPRYDVVYGDLLFGWSGNRGTSFGPFIWKSEGKFYLNQHIFRLSEYNCSKNWLYWTLVAVTAHVEEQAHGIIGMVHITKGKLGNIQVPNLEIDEQLAIASFLDQKTALIDDLIVKKERQIDLMNEKLTTIINRSVTKGLYPDMPMNSTFAARFGQYLPPGTIDIHKQC